MNLQQAHARLGWPKPNEITRPRGEGPAILAEGIVAKIGRNLAAIGESGEAVETRAGALFANSGTDRTETPLAIVCEFSRHVSEQTLLEAQRLAWNFSRTSLLITLEPTRIIGWSCNARPSHDPAASLRDKLSNKIISWEVTRTNDPLADALPQSVASNTALGTLHWINLLAGSHFEKFPESFKSSDRLDSTLVANLLCVRNDLRDRLELPEERCHDLLARLIFVQFLFQRKDSDGRPALHDAKLRKLTADGVLRRTHTTLESILGDYEDAYAFFYWLNEHFNGDLFPGKAVTATDRDREWTEEKRDVKPKHLQLLADFVGGRIDLSDGQGLLWQHYAFDTIPLELISSIYEIFVGPPEKNKSYYTSGHVVDFMLDAVLPWNGKDAGLRVLDPACGSGIFLVKVFQRLVHRWKKKNQSLPKPSDLKRILQGQIFGADINAEAVRVASFSLYLAMCDELDPRQYWTKEKLFPLMRERNLIEADFFSDVKAPLRTAQDTKSFDLVIGNAPWGKGSAAPSSEVQQWATRNAWTVPGTDLGPMFLAKAASLTRAGGWVSMIQPAGLLLNRTGPSQKFRQKLLSLYRIEEIINLAAVRRVIFANAIGPACIVTLRPDEPDENSEFAYVTPKPQGTAEDGTKVVIEPHDVHFVLQREAAENDIVWSALMWGGRRDLELVQRLRKIETLGDLKGRNVIATREGFIRGAGKPVAAPEIVGRRFLWEKRFPCSPFETLDAENLDVNTNPMVHRRDRDRLRAFAPPQLLFKQSWLVEEGRFEAVWVKPDSKGQGALCSDSYVSVHDLTGKHQILSGLWLTLNSYFCPYWFALMAGQFSGFIPKATEKELRQMPVLPFAKSDLPAIIKRGYKAVDEAVASLLGLTASEKLLVEDIHEVVLPDAQRRKGQPPGAQPVTAGQLSDYATTFLAVLRATFGSGLQFSATIYEAPGQVLPARVIAFQLGKANAKPIQTESVQGDNLSGILLRCAELFFAPSNKQISFQKVIDVIDDGSGQRNGRPSLYIVRPNKRRYWVRSLALRDADRLGSLVTHLADAP